MSTRFYFIVAGVCTDNLKRFTVYIHMPACWDGKVRDRCTNALART